MQFVGVDLGTTNIKAAVYDQDLHLMAWERVPVCYERIGPEVSFDAELYVDALLQLLKRLFAQDGVERGKIAEIVFTGQAESLVVLGGDGKPLMPAISWMDERSQEECSALARDFPAPEFERVTGQQAMLPTWPATKILWIRNHRPEVFAAAATYMLLKDYVVCRLTGVRQADRSIATFTGYFDIYTGTYWRRMLQHLQVREAQLPVLAEPCTAAGNVTPAAADFLGIPEAALVNHGTLDHFAGMIGTGNVTPGTVNLSLGTVMGLAALAGEPATGRNCGIAMHYGFLPEMHVMLPVAESGGASLEWFRRTCMPDVSYADLNAVLERRERHARLLFLPYLVGANAPEFDRRASGVFWGLRVEHDRYDMAEAVMKGVAFLLRRNCEFMEERGVQINRIIATGGGAGSDVWCQMQADITGCPVSRPAEREAACLGAAIVGAVDRGIYSSFLEAASHAVRFERHFQPRVRAEYETDYRKYCTLYRAAVELADTT